MIDVGKDFLELCKDKFRYLIEDYNFVLKSSGRKAGNVYKVAYQSKTTAVHINWEFRDNLIYISIYRLINGKLIRNPIIISDDTELTSFDLNNLLQIRQPQAIFESKPHNVNDIARILGDYSNLLRAYGSDVLNGDFSVLPDVERLVKE